MVFATSRNARPPSPRNADPVHERQLFRLRIGQLVQDRSGQRCEGKGRLTDPSSDVGTVKAPWRTAGWTSRMEKKEWEAARFPA